MVITKVLLQKQNKDLRIRLDNHRVSAEMRQTELLEEINVLGHTLSVRDRDVAMLQREIAVLDVSHEALQKENTRLSLELTQKEEELCKAHTEILRLQGIINKDSGNSSKPPSKNGFKRVPNSREKSGRRRGGQIGHPGHRLALPENIEALVEKGSVKEQIVDYTDGSDKYISRYVIDVEVITTLTEYRFATDAQLPAHLYNEVSYGSNLKAMAVLFLNEGIVAEKRLSDMISGLTQGTVTISPATLESFQALFAQRLEESGTLKSIETDLLNGEVMHTDDTPMRCMEKIEYTEDGEEKIIRAEKGSFHATIRTHSNERSTIYTANPKKDAAGADRDGILPKFFGILSHDHESKFYNYGTRHATCGEHLLRELKGLRDLSRIPWAEKMRTYISGMNKKKNQDLETGKTACSSELLLHYEQEYDRLLECGYSDFSLMEKGSLGYDEFRKMLNRLSMNKDNYLLFIRDYKAPFTNNLAERDLRPEKTKERVSLLFQSWEGIRRHTKIRSFISTVKKRKKDIFTSITGVFEGENVLQ